MSTPIPHQHWPSDAEYQAAPRPFYILQYSKRGNSTQHYREHIMPEARAQVYKTEEVMWPHVKPLLGSIWYNRVYVVAEPAARRYLLGHFDDTGSFWSCSYDRCASKNDLYLEHVLRAFKPTQKGKPIDHTHSTFLKRAIKSHGEPKRQTILDPYGREVELNPSGAPPESRMAAILHSIANDPRHPDRPLWFEKYEAEKRMGPDEDAVKTATFYRMPTPINWSLKQ